MGADTLYASEGEYGSKVVAIDLTTGLKKWEFSIPVRDGGAWPSAVDPQRNLLLVTARHWLFTVDSNSGKEIGRHYWWGDSLGYPSLSDGRIFALGQLRYEVGGRNTIGLHCLGPRLKSERIWTVETGVHIDGKMRPFGDSTPIMLNVGNGRVIAPLKDGVACFDKRTGKLQWARDGGLDHRVLCGGVLYGIPSVRSDPNRKRLKLVALDLADGRLLQRIPLSLEYPVAVTPFAGGLAVSECGQDRKKPTILLFKGRS